MEPPGRRKQRRAQWRFMKVDVQRVAEEDPRDETVTACNCIVAVLLWNRCLM